MKNWVSALLAPFRQPEVSAAGRVRDLAPARPVVLRPAAAIQPAPVITASPTPAPDLDLSVFAWLLAHPVDAAATVTSAEHQALAQLDRITTDAHVQAALLPRAAAVVPRLLARLRGPDSSLSALAEQVSRDVTLVVEVIRMANGAGYRRGAAVVELEHAIGMLGVDGLRCAIGRAVLKPLMEPTSGALSLGSARRLWLLTDNKAQLSAAVARGLACEPFDGYLLGLAHSAVWSAVLRVLDTLPREATAWRFSAVFVHELGARRDRLFGVVAQQWQLPTALGAVAAEVSHRGLAAAGGSALAQALHAGDQLASLACSHASDIATALAEPLLANLPASVRPTWRAMAHAPEDTAA